MKVTLLPAFMDNYIFIGQLPNKNCLVVDPGDAQVVTAYLNKEKLKLTHILITHYHQDHFAGVDPLYKDFPEVELIQPLSFPNLTDFSSRSLKIHHLHVKIFKLPGHTLDHIVYLIEDYNIAFVGDVLFGLGCGRVFEGTYAQAYQSLQVIKSWPKEMQIYCAHEYTLKNFEFSRNFYEDRNMMTEQYHEYGRHLREKLTQKMSTIPLLLKEELRYNPFLRADSLEEFQELRELRNSYL